MAHFGPVASYYFTLVILVCLYCAQGIILGLAFHLSTITLQFAPETSYATLTLLGLVMYPFSLKALWSPAVDAWYVPRIGRRMTWILPLQFFLTAFFWCMYDTIPIMLLRGDAWVVVYVGAAMAVCATQDIAIDALAVEALPHDKAKHASSTQNMGQVIGMLTWSLYFQFASVSTTTALPRFLYGAAIFEALVTALTVAYWWFVRNECEHPPPRSASSDSQHSLMDVLRDVRDMAHSRTVRSFVVILLLTPLPYLGSYTMSAQLMKLGMGADVLTRISLVTFPCEFVVSHYASRFLCPERPLHYWVHVYMFCIVTCAFCPFLVYFHDPPHSLAYWAFFVFLTVVVRQCGTFSFMCMYSTFALYCKHEVKRTTSTGTQMTILTSVANLGKSLASSAAFQLLHVISTVSGHMGLVDIVPFYVLCCGCTLLGSLTAWFIVRRHALKIRFDTHEA